MALDEKSYAYLKWKRKMSRRLRHFEHNETSIISQEYRKRVITFLLCYQRKLKPKCIILSRFTLKRLCYPIIRLYNYLQFTFEEYKKQLYEQDDISEHFRNYFLSYKIYYLNQKMITKYNTNIIEEYNKYKGIFDLLLVRYNNDIKDMFHVLISYKDKTIFIDCSIMFKTSCMEKYKTYLWKYYLHFLLENLDKIILTREDITYLTNI
jgi:hypothetical protein